jgi:predicted transcriptional regulator
MHVLFGIKMGKNLAKGAPAIMRQKGIDTDYLVMQRILEKPGSTVHEVARDLGWTNGRVDGSANRLLKERRIRVRHYIRRGMLVKKMYPAGKETREPNVVEISKEMIAENLWNETVHVYALSRSSIGLSATKNEEWEKRAFWKGDTKIGESQKKLIVRLPDDLADFYRLENSETSLSANDDFALLTVESTIIPVELPGTFPVQPVYRRTRYLFMVDTIEGVSTEAIEPDLYGEYPEGEQRTTHISGVPQGVMNVLRLVKKKRARASDTSGPVETPVEAVVG